MKINIVCECGNQITIEAPRKKYLQMRDNLETKMFRYDGAEIKEDKLKEIHICCDKCGNRISLGFD